MLTLSHLIHLLAILVLNGPVRILAHGAPDSRRRVRSPLRSDRHLFPPALCGLADIALLPLRNGLRGLGEAVRELRTKGLTPLVDFGADLHGGLVGPVRQHSGLVTQRSDLGGGFRRNLFGLSGLSGDVTGARFSTVKIDATPRWQDQDGYKVIVGEGSEDETK